MNEDRLYKFLKKYTLTDTMDDVTAQKWLEELERIFED